MESINPPYVLITVHFNDPDAISTLVASASTWTLPPTRVVVIDNSGDLPQFGSAAVTVIDPGDNVGYASAVNRGLKLASELGHDFALICTQDGRLERAASAILIDGLESSENVAVCAPSLRFADSPNLVFSNGGKLARNGMATHPGQGEKVAGSLPYRFVDVDWADGALLMVRVQTLIRLGLFDENYFLYVEEIDMQHRAHIAGFRVLLAPHAIGYQQPGNYTPYLRFRNSVYMSRKFEDLRPWPWRRQLVREVIKRLLGRPSADPRAARRGVRDAMSNLMGKPSRSE